jgi:hypothetical protein
MQLSLRSVQLRHIPILCLVNLVLAWPVSAQHTGAINVSITVALKPPGQIPCLHHLHMLICALMNEAETKLLECALYGHLPDTFSRWVRQRTDHLTVRRLPSSLY